MKLLFKLTETGLKTTQEDTITAKMTSQTTAQVIDDGYHFAVLVGDIACASNYGFIQNVTSLPRLSINIPFSNSFTSTGTPIITGYDLTHTSQGFTNNGFTTYSADVIRGFLIYPASHIYMGLVNNRLHGFMTNRGLGSLPQPVKDSIKLSKMIYRMTISETLKSSNQPITNSFMGYHYVGEKVGPGSRMFTPSFSGKFKLLSSDQFSGTTFLDDNACGAVSLAVKTPIANDFNGVFTTDRLYQSLAFAERQLNASNAYEGRTYQYSLTLDSLLTPWVFENSSSKRDFSGSPVVLTESGLAEVAIDNNFNRNNLSINQFLTLATTTGSDIIEPTLNFDDVYVKV